MSSSSVRASVSSSDRIGLAREVTGPVLLPGDVEYSAEVAGINRIVGHRPAVVVGATCADDVRAAVRFAAGRGLPAAVLATGHGPATEMPGGVMITTRRMTGIVIDPANARARVEAGVLWQPLVDAAAGVGLAPLVASSPTVGVVGYTLGGGLSVTMGRAHGWAADHVHAIDVVTPDGELHHATETTSPDLFWALRGGKSNFGVVTALEFALFEVRRLYAGHLVFDGEHAPAVLHAFRRFAANAPEEVMSSVALIRLPDLPSSPELLRGRLTVRLRFSYLGSEAVGAELIAPLRAAAPVLADLVRERPYSEFAAIDPTSPQPAANATHFATLRELTPATVEAILEVVGPGADTAINLVDLRQLGGKLARPGRSDSAVGRRDAAFMTQILTGPSPDGTAPSPSAGLELLDRLGPWLSEHPHPNFLAPLDATEARTAAAFEPATYRRLRAIKQHYDPTNMFRFNFNIPAR